jgi:hypothetical protein
MIHLTYARNVRPKWVIQMGEDWYMVNRVNVVKRGCCILFGCVQDEIKVSGRSIFDGSLKTMTFLEYDYVKKISTIHLPDVRFVRVNPDGKFVGQYPSGDEKLFTPTHGVTESNVVFCLQESKYIAMNPEFIYCETNIC